MVSYEDAPEDDRINRNRQVMFTRDPAFMDWVAAQYAEPSNEQEIIKAGLRDIATQRERGLTPEDLLKKFEQFVEASSGEFRGAVSDGDVCFQCDETGASIILKEIDSGGGVSIDIRVSIPTDEDV